MRSIFPILSFLYATALAVEKPFLIPLNSTTGWVIGNGLWNITIGDVYGKELFYEGRDLIGDAVGHYSGYDGESNFVWTSASVYQETPEYLDVVFSATEIDLHWIIYPDLAGAYQYIENKALPTLAVLRTLFRLDNTTFTHGRTNIKDEALPLFSDILASTKVQDETWQRADGTFITKYDWSDFIRNLDFHGVYGSEFGSWYIRPGRDYFNGNHLKQELTVHRESATGDAVELNVIHGSHFQVNSSATFPAGKIWGPWLWYLNSGSRDDAASRAAQEFASWPYSWLNDSDYQSRGSVSGTLILSDGRPAAGASVFLGDNNSNKSTLDQGEHYYYAGTADSQGSFDIKDVRTGTYGFYAWSDGGSIANVSTTFSRNDIAVQNGDETALGLLTWETQARKPIFQIGEIDHKTLGFRNGGAPYQHALVAQSPANLTYTIGQSNASDWYFGQSALGAWTILFDLTAADVSSNTSAVLSLSLAGYSQTVNLDVSINSQVLASLTSTTLPSDPGLYRSGTTAGEWRFLEFDIEAGVLTAGTNSLVFEVTRTTLWRGFMWDSIILEWK
ncbi:Rhamnogalacturonate lyase [Lachnellula subtilissima]|uniref:rhamnogalacturonan endolyase n=1 Tax=Lachnellula subtilissima TaxID=602034 RepID=A0A8H8U4K6_9HELO|nr:Rhamnogalacturonate lyase [Lachnellula subtilissima]